ncbi:hypothetical protein V9T40_008940 [Parthenolecanium corni]|uniref:Ig-like domain-containing protein n=1 Tax=Parthenolecanium corni TaxID=536013 RepID=A0AAN9TYX4_9HEMI
MSGVDVCLTMNYCHVHSLDLVRPFSNCIPYDVVPKLSKSEVTCHHVRAEDDTVGPTFIKEPPNKIDFSNSTGATLECTVRGNPAPEIIWLRSDGTAVGDVPGLRQVLPNGNLMFPPFRAEDYRQEVHAQAYICMARNSVGSIHSRDVNVRAVVIQSYDTDVNKEYTIRGNAAILKCQIPSYVADFLSVISWHTDKGDDFVPSTDFVVIQAYETDVIKEFAIRGNAAIIKCQVPSYVADFVNVISWHTDKGEEFHPGKDYVVEQDYRTGVNDEYVIRGNSAILKCSIPSFLSDFVVVIAWLDNANNVYEANHNELNAGVDNYIVTQDYLIEVNNEHVIKGNTAIVKCFIPSFVADFVYVYSWTDNKGNEYSHSTINSKSSHVVIQYYDAEVVSEYVIRGNTAILKCNIPSFVADFVFVDAWIRTDGLEYTATNDFVVNQMYEADILKEFVIKGNTGILKCSIPSFVADFVYVDAWISDANDIYEPTFKNFVVNQKYEAEILTEYVINGNAGILKCNIPSFVADFVQVESWIRDDGVVYKHTEKEDFGRVALEMLYDLVG